MKKQFLTHKYGILCTVLLCCLLWGSAYPCVKLSYTLFQVSPGEPGTLILLAGLRFLLSGILTVLFGSILEGRLLVPQRESYGKVCILAFFQTVFQYTLFYIGMAHTTGVKGAIIEATNVFASILISVYIFHQESMTARKAIGCIIGFFGVVLINLTGEGFGTGFRWDGEGAVFLSSLSYAVSSVLTKRFAQRENPVILSGYQFLLGSLAMLLIGFAAGGRIGTVSGWAWILLVYLGFLSAVAYSLWALLLKYNPVSKIAVYGFLNPLLGSVMSAVFLAEYRQMPVFRSLTALLLVCTGIYSVNRNKPVSRSS